MNEAALAEARERGINSLGFFVRDILGYGFMDAKIHDDMFTFCEHIFDAPEPWSQVLIPRGHGKSFGISVGHSIWRLIRNPDMKIMILHGVVGLAEALMSMIIQQFESNALLRKLYPSRVWSKTRMAPRWTQNEIIIPRKSIDHTPSIAASSVESAKTGRHFDLIIFDDIVHAENCKTPEQLQKTKDFIRTVPPLRVDRHSRFVDVGTRWSYDDAHGELADKTGPYGGKVRTMVRSCWEVDGEVPIWPSKWTKEELEAERRLMGNYLFSANYLNNPSPEGTMVFNEGDVQRTTCEWDPSTGRTTLPDGRRYHVFTAVDPNTRESTEHDPAVVITVARDSSGNHYVLEMSRGHPNPTELISWIRHHVTKHRPITLFLETVTAAKQFVHWLQKDALDSGVVYPLREVTRGPAEQKLIRIKALAPLVETKRLHVPMGKMFEPLMQEIRLYSSAAKKDDCLDALADIFAFGTNPPREKKRDETPDHDILLSEMAYRMERDDRLAKNPIRCVEHTTSGSIRTGLTTRLNEARRKILSRTR